jgi:hypothetical protein
MLITISGPPITGRTTVRVPPPIGRMPFLLRPLACSSETSQRWPSSMPMSDNSTAVVASAGATIWSYVAFTGLLRGR